jgi:hypothetical protein
VIISPIQGGLGNQLFQWAHGYSLARELGTPLHLDLSFYESQHSPHLSRRSFELGFFQGIEINPWSRDQSLSTDLRVLREPYSPEDINLATVFPASRDFYLEGYWQCEKYFNAHRPEIMDILSRDLPTSLLPRYDFTDSCALHIRRGDYLSSGGYHPVQPLSYYKKSLDILQPQGNILIFSDDIPWCHDNLNFQKMIFMEGNSSIEDLFLMSLCPSIIMANSSFSWWGAWLNSNKDKKIIYPRNWLGDSSAPLPEFPPDWRAL